MEIINSEKGWYICIDMAGVGFAESEWYSTQEQLMIAIINNNIKWHSRHLTKKNTADKSRSTQTLYF